MRFSVPAELPAIDVLKSEGIYLNSGVNASVKPLRILLLNLMPTKTVTENQIIRMLAHAGCDVELSLMKTLSYTAKNADSDYMMKFYKGFDAYKDEYFDGFIVTGAPVELFDYTQVLYWDELCRVLDWAQTHVRSIYSICWGAQALLYYYYGIKKRTLPEKMFGVFEHTLCDNDGIFTAGLKSNFPTPHSRHTEVIADDILRCNDLRLSAVSQEAGVHIVVGPDNKFICSMGHPEYDSDTLSREYFRDLGKGDMIAIPKHYFPNDDAASCPKNTWRDVGIKIYGNWLKYLDETK